MKWKFALLCLVLLVVFPANYSFAFDASSVDVDLSPANPGPNENVTIRLTSFSINLDSVLITWLVDGKITLSGIGLKSFSAKSGNTGTETMITAKISLPDGVLEKKIVLRPTIMVLLWQAMDSYVPPFYRGKALPILDTDIKVIAMPEIKVSSGIANPKGLTYTWQKNYSTQPSAGGYGKSSYVYKSDYLESAETISVIASTVDGTYSSEGRVAVAPADPVISFYKRDKKLGFVWDRALGNGHIIDPEGETVFAVPYYVAPKEIARPDLTFRWYINESPVGANNFIKNLLPIKAEAGTSGTSSIRLEVGNRYKFFQTAKKEINVQF